MSHTDEELIQVTHSMLKRNTRGLIHYEMLYFLKEINKLDKSALLSLKN